MGQQILGRKQKISNDAWLEAMKQIEDLVPKSELDARVGQTVKDIMATTNGKKAAVAWSGGKDSLVLADVCRQAGIEDSVLVVSNLEYSAFTEWVDRNKPPKLEIINTGQDIEWLVKHPQMLFPQDSNTAAQWFHIVQHRGQAKYYKAHELDISMYDNLDDTWKAIDGDVFCKSIMEDAMSACNLKIDRSIIKQKLGIYAAKRPDEFVAEAVSSTKNTKLEKTVKKLFKERTSE